MYTCKYCMDKFDNKEDLQMHEINCKSNPYSHAHAIDKNNFVGFEKTVVVAKNDRERKKLEKEVEKKLDSSYDVEFRVIKSFLQEDCDG